MSTANKLKAIEEFVQYARSWDLTYSFSDDPTLFRRGEAQRKQLSELADKLAEATSRQFAVELYNEIVAERMPENARQTFEWVYMEKN